MSLRTKEQKMAQAAFGCVSKIAKSEFDEYNSFALSFPSLVHSCGLAQALAFAQAKQKQGYIKDLETVLEGIEQSGICKLSREADLTNYTRMSRHVLMASTWIKRYCQAKGE